MIRDAVEGCDARGPAPREVASADVASANVASDLVECQLEPID